MAADNCGAGGDLRTPAPRTTKRTNTTVPFNDVEGTPAGVFHGGSFGVSGTPPGAQLEESCEASGLENHGAEPLRRGGGGLLWQEARLESDNTGPLANTSEDALA